MPESLVRVPLGRTAEPDENEVRARGEGGRGGWGRADGLGFFTVMTLLEGKDMSAVKEKWRQVSSIPIGAHAYGPSRGWRCGVGSVLTSLV
jgi:hypothetical protein